MQVIIKKIIIFLMPGSFSLVFTDYFNDKKVIAAEWKGNFPVKHYKIKKHVLMDIILVYYPSKKMVGENSWMKKFCLAH